MYYSLGLCPLSHFPQVVYAHNLPIAGTSYSYYYIGTEVYIFFFRSRLEKENEE